MPTSRFGRSQGLADEASSIASKLRRRKRQTNIEKLVGTRGGGSGDVGLGLCLPSNLATRDAPEQRNNISEPRRSMAATGINTGLVGARKSVGAVMGTKWHPAKRLPAGTFVHPVHTDLHTFGVSIPLLCDTQARPH